MTPQGRAEIVVGRVFGGALPRAARQASKATRSGPRDQLVADTMPPVAAAQAQPVASFIFAHSAPACADAGPAQRRAAETASIRSRIVIHSPDCVAMLRHGR